MRILALVALAAALSPAAARAQTPAGYCDGDGGPAGAATDAEHHVLVGDPPLPAGVRTSRISVDGIGTRVQEAGPPGAREAVVFLHGNPGSSRDWDALLAASGTFSRAIAFDISGWGQSDEGANPFQSIEGAARYVGGALDRLGVDRAVLAVHDLGGIWGLDWARAHPDRLLGAVLVNSGVFIDYVPHPHAWIWATPGAGEAQMASTTRDSFSEYLQASNPRRLPEAFVDRMYDDYDRATRCASLRYYRSAFGNVNRGREQAAALREHRRPALVVWGERDVFVPREHAERQRQAFPDARVEFLPDSGHWPFVDNPDRVRDLVTGFLRPGLDVERARLVAQRRRVPVTVHSSGPLPALDVRARLHAVDRRGRSTRVLAAAASPAVRGRRRLSLLSRRALRPGRYEVEVGAHGLPTRRLRVTVRATSH